MEECVVKCVFCVQRDQKGGVCVKLFIHVCVYDSLCPESDEQQERQQTWSFTPSSSFWSSPACTWVWHRVRRKDFIGFAAESNFKFKNFSHSFKTLRFFFASAQCRAGWACGTEILPKPHFFINGSCGLKKKKSSSNRGRIVFQVFSATLYTSWICQDLLPEAHLDLMTSKKKTLFALINWSDCFS